MYNYQTERPWVFTNEGQRQFLKVRDFAHKTCRIAGAVRADKLIEVAGAGDTWKMMACIDRLVELGELRAVYIPTSAWQCRIFEMD